MQSNMIEKKGLVAAVALVSLAATASAQDMSPLITEGIVDAPTEAVWRAWTTNEGLKSWLAPHVSMDRRVGGLMRTNYNAAGVLGDAQTIENTVLSFEPERMLSIKVTKGIGSISRHNGHSQTRFPAVRAASPS